jgi:hypothetical protein
METAKVPLVSTTWRPCLLCGLLLASKVWQDLRLEHFFHSGQSGRKTHGIHNENL